MNAGYISALAALAGSAIGALASFATTWMTQRFQDRAQRLAQTLARRERLYGDFIDEASRLFGDAFTHQLEDPSKMVALYAIRSKLMLFASPAIIAEANASIHALAQGSGIVVAEVFDGMNQRDLFGISPDRDPIHPNEQGYRVLADIWLQALMQAVPGGLTAALRRR